VERKKIKLGEEAIKILVGDNDSESGSEASDFEEYFEKKKRIIIIINNKQTQQKSIHRLQQVAHYQPGDHINEGTQIFILL
jgi:hypothetical protein